MTDRESGLRNKNKQVRQVWGFSRESADCEREKIEKIMEGKLQVWITASNVDVK